MPRQAHLPHLAESMSTTTLFPRFTQSVRSPYLWSPIFVCSHLRVFPTVLRKLETKVQSDWPIPEWSRESSEVIMEEHSIGSAILSLTSPGVSILDGEASSQLAREVNEYAAEIRDSSPSSFGFFATIPPPINNDNTDNTAAALAEIAYALDVLHADGVTLFTRYGPGNGYLGHDAIEPVWADLSKRQAVVFIHPTSIADAHAAVEKVPQPVIDYPHETTRAAVDLIINNRLRDYPDCKVILSHAGGTIPYLVARAAHLLADSKFMEKTAEEFIEDARKFYYDVALSTNEYPLGLLRKFVKRENILFGTDYPYADQKTIASNVAWMNAAETEMDEEEEWDLRRGNAIALFPRFEDETKAVA